MESKALFVVVMMTLLLALFIDVTNAELLETAAGDPEITSLGIANQRSRRQFFGGLGGFPSNSNSNAVAFASSNGGGGLPFGGSSSQAVAFSSANSGSFGK